MRIFKIREAFDVTNIVSVRIHQINDFSEKVLKANLFAVDQVEVEFLNNGYHLFEL